MKLTCFVLTGLMTLAPACASAQGYPTKPMRMLIGFPAGSSSDVVGRLVAAKLTESFGRSVVFDNRPGAGGNIAAELVAKSVKELIALAKAKPRALNVASSGAGNSDHFAYELFRSMTGAEMVHVPYKGGGPASVDVMSGQVAAYFSGMAGGLPLARAGRVRALAVTTAKRTPIAPDIPTMVEAGVAGYEHVLWNAVFAPAATPKTIIARLDAELAKAVSASDVRERFVALGVEPQSRTSEEMTRYLKGEVDKYGKIVRAIGLKID